MDHLCLHIDNNLGIPFDRPPLFKLTNWQPRRCGKFVFSYYGGVAPSSLESARRAFVLRSLQNAATLPISKRPSDGVVPGDNLPAILTGFQMLRHHLLAPGTHLVRGEARERAFRRMARRAICLAGI
jgi:hypothetical protein